MHCTDVLATISLRDMKLQSLPVQRISDRKYLMTHTAQVRMKTRTTTWTSEQVPLDLPRCPTTIPTRIPTVYPLALVSHMKSNTKRLSKSRKHQNLCMSTDHSAGGVAEEELHVMTRVEEEVAAVGRIAGKTVEGVAEAEAEVEVEAIGAHNQVIQERIRQMSMIPEHLVRFLLLRWR